MIGTDVDQQWPPRSPFEALLSSPSGRSQVRRYQDPTSPSPSLFENAARPSRSDQSKFTVRNQTTQSDEEDEDEETLQLRLQELEAKLKLKQLRQKKKDAGPFDVRKLRTI
ncbi:MAG: hypothetical protein Q9198_006819 [Flavoplaca austrocitrina]